MDMFVKMSVTNVFVLSLCEHTRGSDAGINEDGNRIPCSIRSSEGAAAIFWNGAGSGSVHEGDRLSDSSGVGNPR